LEWFWLGLSWSSWFSLCYVADAKPVCMVLGLATGGMHVISIGLAIGGMPMCSIGLATSGMPVSVGQFGYRCDSCELVALVDSSVT
jgi:hypothetical protein